MKDYLNKIKVYIVGHKILSIIIAILVILIVRYVYQKVTNTAGDTRYITTKVQKGTIIASVTGTGQVSVSSQIDIKPKVYGQITWVGISAGQKVNHGQALLSIDSRDAEKAVRDAQVSLESAKISLEKLKIQNSNDNLNADLIKAYDDGFTSVSNAFLDLPSVVTGLEDTLGLSNLSDNSARMSGSIAQDYRKTAEETYYKAQSAFEKNRIDYRSISNISSKQDIEKIIIETYETTKIISDAVKNSVNFVDYMAEDTGRTSDFASSKNTLSTYTNTTNTHLSNLLSIKTSIKNYKDAFINSDFDIQASELSVKQKENALQDAKDKLADYTVRAPFSGVISVLNAKLGDNTSSGSIATIITSHQLAEISLNEVDVAKIKLAEKATLTFDAIPDLSISGKVEEIDSVGKIDQGVVTYNVKISFDTQDMRVKPSMSVSASIVTDTKTDILFVPNSAVKSNNKGNYVEIFDAPLVKSTDGLAGKISKVIPNKIQVEIGISNDSQTEIISGVKEGDDVISRTILPGVVKTKAPSKSPF
ncbi:MAG: efflux RND transporter periplasmic adaptor subunit [Candidatus Nomurabacteria bacterium]|nr:efflux RND transporter periplasmic adaptor subunit [Candidatus Nomurabacteria bacterium]